MDETQSWFSRDSIVRVTLMVVAFGVFSLYTAMGAFAAVVFPPAAVVFLLPLVISVVAVAPAAKASPSWLATRLIIVGLGLLPLWPVYLHLKLGPLPIITPPRLILYFLTAIWLYDMVFSPLRRAQLLFAFKQSRIVGGLVLLFFFLGLASLPMAAGRSLAAPEFFRQAIIWFLPFLITATYIRRSRHFVAVMKAVTIGAGFAGLIAIAEAASGQLLASVLSPIIPNDQEWLRVAQQIKIRDGIFRAQATHTHPLSLGEFLAVAAPFAAAFFIRAETILQKGFWLGLIAVVVLGALLTSSRGALLGIIVAGGASGAVIGFRFLQTAASVQYRPLAGLLALLILATSPVFMVGAYKMVTGAGGASASNSSQARLDQIELAIPKIMKRPVGGYGTGRAARALGYWGRTLTIDNYYLTLALDLGLPGPLVFAAILIATGGGSLRRAKSDDKDVEYFYFAVFAMCAVIFISRTITSLTGNLSLFYPIIGAFVGAASAQRVPKTLAS